MTAEVLAKGRQAQLGRCLAVAGDDSTSDSDSGVICGAAVSGVVSSMLRVAERDFESAFVADVAVCEGPVRNLWASRRRGWPSDEDLGEANCLLERLGELLGQGRAPGRQRLHALTFVIAPVEARGKRRQKKEGRGVKPGTMGTACRIDAWLWGCGLLRWWVSDARKSDGLRFRPHRKKTNEPQET